MASPFQSIPQELARRLELTYSDLGAGAESLSTVDEGNLLSEVEGGVLGRGNTLNLDERGAGVGVALAPLVRKVASLDSRYCNQFHAPRATPDQSPSSPSSA